MSEFDIDRRRCECDTCRASREWLDDAARAHIAGLGAAYPPELELGALHLEVSAPREKLAALHAEHQLLFARWQKEKRR